MREGTGNKEQGAGSREQELVDTGYLTVEVVCFPKKFALSAASERGRPEKSWLYSRCLFWVTGLRWRLGEARRGRRWPQGYGRGLWVEVEETNGTVGRQRSEVRPERTASVRSLHSPVGAWSSTNSITPESRRFWSVWRSLSRTNVFSGCKSEKCFSNL